MTNGLFREPDSPWFGLACFLLASTLQMGVAVGLKNICEGASPIKPVPEFLTALRLPPPRAPKAAEKAVPRPEPEPQPVTPPPREPTTPPAPQTVSFPETTPPTASKRISTPVRPRLPKPIRAPAPLPRPPKVPTPKPRTNDLAVPPPGPMEFTTLRNALEQARSRPVSRPRETPGSVSPNRVGSESAVPQKISAIQRYLARLRDELERRKEYPPEAREKGIQGKITLEFAITMDGKPREPRATGAGAEILEKAALAMLVERALPKPPPGWNPETRIGIPVVFSLR